MERTRKNLKELLDNKEYEKIASVFISHCIDIHNAFTQIKSAKNILTDIADVPYPEDHIIVKQIKNPNDKYILRVWVSSPKPERSIGLIDINKNKITYAQI